MGAWHVLVLYACAVWRLPSMYNYHLKPPGAHDSLTSPSSLLATPPPPYLPCQASQSLVARFPKMSSLGLPLLSLVAAFTGGVHAASVCNGYAALCDKLYSNVTFIGSHDSAFDGILLVDNQFDSVADQLSLGVRFLQAQSHNDDGTIELCHTTCSEEDAGSLETWLDTIVTFLEANPNEVITLLITNGDGIDGAEFADVFEASGAADYAYSPGSTLTLSEWPTLGELIDDGSRLVVFMDYPAGTSVSYILDEFTSYILYVKPPHASTPSRTDHQITVRPHMSKHQIRPRTF